jgi:adhesin/invasin
MRSVSRAARSPASRPSSRRSRRPSTPERADRRAQQPTVDFVGDPSTISALLTTASAAPAAGVIADGSAVSTITVDGARQQRQPRRGPGGRPRRDRQQQHPGQPGLTDAFGVASGTIASTSAETKTITATVNPGASQIVVAQQPTVEFVADPNNISAVLSTASASPATGVLADGSAISTITVTLRDQNGNPVPGQAVELSSTGGNNILVQPGLTDAFGVASGTIASTTAETKIITATVNPGASQVVVAQQPTVDFVADPNNISAVLTTATASPATGVLADGLAVSTITVTVRDQNGNPVAGQAVDLAASGSNNVLVQPGLTERLRRRERHHREHHRRAQDDHRNRQPRSEPGSS